MKKFKKSGCFKKMFVVRNARKFAATNSSAAYVANVLDYFVKFLGGVFC